MQLSASSVISVVQDVCAPGLCTKCSDAQTCQNSCLLCHGAECTERSRRLPCELCDCYWEVTAAARAESGALERNGVFLVLDAVAAVDVNEIGLEAFHFDFVHHRIAGDDEDVANLGLARRSAVDRNNA